MQKSEKNFNTYMRTGKHPDLRALDTQGGVMVPVSMADKIHEFSSEYWPLTSLASKDLVSDTAKMNLPYFKSGITLNWLDEGGSHNETAASIDGAMFKLHKYGVMFKITEEVVFECYYNIDDFIADILGRGLGEILEESYINGQGVNGPRGFLCDCKNYRQQGML